MSYQHLSSHAAVHCSGNLSAKRSFRASHVSFGLGLLLIGAIRRPSVSRLWIGVVISGLDPKILQRVRRGRLPHLPIRANGGSMSPHPLDPEPWAHIWHAQVSKY